VVAGAWRVACEAVLPGSHFAYARIAFCAFRRPLDEACRRRLSRRIFADAPRYSPKNVANDFAKVTINFLHHSRPEPTSESQSIATNLQSIVTYADRLPKWGALA